MDGNPLFFEGTDVTPQRRSNGSGIVARRALGMSTPRRARAVDNGAENGVGSSSPVLNYPSSSSPVRRGVPATAGRGRESAGPSSSNGVVDSDPLHFPSLVSFSFFFLHC